jgi:hypothetical protein
MESGGKQRIYFYNDDGFVDLYPIEYFGLNISTYDFCSYWAIIKMGGTIQIVFFNDKGWFDEWCLGKDIEIIYQRGKVETKVSDE